MSRCRDVVEVVARALADRPDAVRVTERQHKGQTLVELFMAPGDLGRVIGRQGRTAAAMRTLVARMPPAPPEAAADQAAQPAS